MNRFLTLFSAVATVALTLSISACNQGGNKKVNVDNEKELQGYAIGYQMGRGFEPRMKDLDKDSFFQGINDGIKGKAQIDEGKLKEALRKYQERMMAEFKKKMESQGGAGAKEMSPEDKKRQEYVDAQMKLGPEKILAQGKKFLAENAKKSGVKSTKSGLQYKVIKAGKGKSPKATDKVRVHYKGMFTNTEISFDSSYKRNQPAEFPLNGVIKGWTEGLQLMKEGGTTQFYIPAELAYGSGGRPGIPPNSVLIFDVELLKIL